MRIWTLLAFLTLSLAVQAGTMGPLLADQPVHWHGGTIKLGDAEARVRQIAGRYPDSAQPLYLGDHHVIGERWTFLGTKDDPRELYIEFTRGRVSRLWTEAPDESGQPLSQRP